MPEPTLTAARLQTLMEAMPQPRPLRTYVAADAGPLFERLSEPLRLELGPGLPAIPYQAVDWLPDGWAMLIAPSGEVVVWHLTTGALYTPTEAAHLVFGPARAEAQADDA